MNEHANFLAAIHLIITGKLIAYRRDNILTGFNIVLRYQQLI